MNCLCVIILMSVIVCFHETVWDKINIWSRTVGDIDEHAGVVEENAEIYGKYTADVEEYSKDVDLYDAGGVVG